METAKKEIMRKRYTNKKIAVLMGGMSSERDISLKTGGAILASLHRSGYAAMALDAGRDIAEKLKANAIEVAFLALHGSFGEDGTIQGMLELLGIPYTGSGVLASALAMNKTMTKKILAWQGLPTPAFQVVGPQDCTPAGLASLAIQPPLVVKAPEEGSSIGVYIVKEAAGLQEAVRAALGFGRELLIEQYIEGRELTAAVLDGDALPVVEIIPRDRFYDYQAKYHSQGATGYVVAPDIGPELTARIQRYAVQTYAALGCSGAARVDFLLAPDGDPSILEINTIPGMTETSLLPKAAGHAGISFDELVERILWSSRLHKTRTA